MSFGINTLNAQSISAIESIEGIDSEFLKSLPESVRGDIMSEMTKSKDDMSDGITKRPSTELSKLKTVQDWEKFKKASKFYFSSIRRASIRAFGATIRRWARSSTGRQNL